MIALDKQAHFLGGYALAITVGIFSPWVGLAVALAAAAGKELYDYKHPATHTVDIKDFVATATGGVLGFFVSHAASVFGF